jgi:hypothetical protein
MNSSICAILRYYYLKQQHLMVVLQTAAEMCSSYTTEDYIGIVCQLVTCAFLLLHVGGRPFRLHLTLVMHAAFLIIGNLQY